MIIVWPLYIDVRYQNYFNIACITLYFPAVHPVSLIFSMGVIYPNLNSQFDNVHIYIYIKQNYHFWCSLWSVVCIFSSVSCLLLSFSQRCLHSSEDCLPSHFLSKLYILQGDLVILPFCCRLDRGDPSLRICSTILHQSFCFGGQTGTASRLL